MQDFMYREKRNARGLHAFQGEGGSIFFQARIGELKCVSRGPVASGASGRVTSRRAEAVGTPCRFPADRRWFSRAAISRAPHVRQAIVPCNMGLGAGVVPRSRIDNEQVGAHARHTHGAERNRHEQYKQDGDREQREVTHVQPRHCASWSSNAQNSGATFFRARPMQTCLQRGGRGSSEYGGDGREGG